MSILFGVLLDMRKNILQKRLARCGIQGTASMGDEHETQSTVCALRSSQLADLECMGGWGEAEERESKGGGRLWGTAAEIW